MDTNGTIKYIRDTSPKSYNVVYQVEPNLVLFNGEPRNHVNLLDTETCTVNTLPQRMGHHDVVYDTVTGNILTLRKDIVSIDGMDYEHDKLVELDQMGVELWHWTTADYFSHELACNYSAVRRNSLDLTHCNSIDWDKENGIAYVNIRNLNTFCKINTTTGDMIWSLGEHGDFELYNENGLPVDSLWYHAHSVEQVEPNVFLLFDNDLHNKTYFDNRRSRILEVTVDEDNMTAYTSWVWTAPREKFCGYWCDADRLPNGNRLGVFGTQHHDIENSTGAWLVEVNPSGEVVREYDFPYGWGMYRCEVIDNEMFTAPSFAEYSLRYAFDDVTMIYPSDAVEKARECSPASSSDWYTAALLYPGLMSLTETMDTDPTVVNQTTGELLLESGALTITFGGPLVNPVTGYYESTDTPIYNMAPLRCMINGNWIEIHTRNGSQIAGIPLEQVNNITDYFIIEVFRDGRGRTTCICYGLGWKGTMASGKYLVREFGSLLMSEESWIVGYWEDKNLNNFVNGPAEGDYYNIIATG